jgi:hypothetical protein
MAHRQETEMMALGVAEGLLKEKRNFITDGGWFALTLELVGGPGTPSWRSRTTRLLSARDTRDRDFFL